MRFRPALCWVLWIWPFALYAQLDDAAIVQLSAADLQAQIAAGTVSAERAALAFLNRIAELDDAGPELRAIIEINPDALSIARALDRRLAREGPLGALHGLPVVLKANIDTADRMATTAGSLALAGHRAEADAALVRRLREAGAVILAKANLSEWANFRSDQSTSGWSSLGGQTRNPYVLDRNPCGSSSGSAVAVAARLTPLAVGTETDGSIVCPAGANGVVGIKPTVGLVSPIGIIPLAPGQDTAGPMARTVHGAALLLAAMAEPNDEAGRTAGYAAQPADLGDVRLGVIRDYFGAGRAPAVESRYEEWLTLLRAAGAVLVDPVTVGLEGEIRAAELDVLLYEFHASIDEYLLATNAAPASLTELISFNREHSAAVMPYFGQELLIRAEATGPLSESRYQSAVAASRGRMRALLDTLFAAHALDALLAPVNGPAWRTDPQNGDRLLLGSASLAALSGRPSIAVPGALLAELPVAIAFIGRPFEEAELIGIAAAFEALRGPLPAPKFLPSLEPPR
jgi:amidase